MASSGVPTTRRLPRPASRAGGSPSSRAPRRRRCRRNNRAILEAEFAVLERLLARFGDVDGADEAQRLRVHPAAVLGGGVVGDLPVDRQRIIAARLGRGDAEHAEAVTSGELAARGRHRRGDADFRMRPGIGQQLAGRVDEGEPVGLVGDRARPSTGAVSLRWPRPCGRAASTVRCPSRRRPTAEGRGRRRTSRGRASDGRAG